MIMTIMTIVIMCAKYVMSLGVCFKNLYVVKVDGFASNSINFMLILVSGLKDEKWMLHEN